MARTRQNRISIEEIAQALNISKTTVSRALSGKGRISEATRSRVRSYVASTGAAPAVRSGWSEENATHNLTMVIPDHFVRLDLPFLRKCMGGITTMAVQRGYDMLLCYTNASDTSQLQRQLANHKMDGVILSRALKDDPCVDLLRREGRHRAAAGASLDDEEMKIDAVDPAPSPQDVAERRELREQVEAGLAALSPEHRQVLVLREMHQLSYDEISQVLSLDVGTVKSRISRGRRQLRKFLLESGNFSGAAASKETEKEGCK